MKLEIQKIWSPDLDPPSEGIPDDIEDYDIFMQVSLGETGNPGGEVFSFSVSPPSALARIEPNRFISHILVMDYFSWDEVRNRLKQLLRHAESCKSCGMTSLKDYPGV